MADALGQEIIDAYNNTGNVVKKKSEVHRMAQANRAFVHLRW
jgi:small subunit ribosomal protein S7